MKNIKEASRFKLFLITLSLISISACNDNMTNSGNNFDTYEIKVWDYSDNHYFLDTIYKQSYFDYYNNITISSLTDSISVDDQSFEVWVQTDSTTIGYRIASLHIDLPSLPVNGYDDTLKLPINEPGIRTFGYVRKMFYNEYILNKYAGYVSLKTNLPENYFAGVAFKRTNTGEEFGTISTNVNVAPTDTLVLKTIKVQNLVPNYLLAWELKLKNIYQLPKTNIVREGFEFNIKYQINGNYSFTLPNINTYLITILGLDKYTNGRSGSPDNKFDYLSGSTIDPENGWIIFPTLKPFLTNLSEYNLNGQTINPAYWYPQIYSEVKQNASLAPNANNYLLSGYFLK